MTGPRKISLDNKRIDQRKKQSGAQLEQKDLLSHNLSLPNHFFSLLSRSETLVISFTIYEKNWYDFD